MILDDRTETAFLWYKNEWVKRECVDAEQFELFHAMNEFLRAPEHRHMGIHLYEVCLEGKAWD